MQYKSSDDILLWPDNFWCYRHEYAKYENNSDFVVIPVGSLFYPDGITIHEVDYDTIINARIAMLNFQD